MTRSESGVKIGKLTIRLIQSHNVKVLVGRNDRRDLPHLTVSWKNPTGEIDIHLTRRVKGGEEHHESLGKITESDLDKVAEAFGTQLGMSMQSRMGELRKIRPGWLARNGYWLSHLSKDAQSQLIESLAPKKKRHGKWTRSIEDDVLEQLALSQEVADSIYHPAMLHNLSALDCHEVVFAQATRRKRRGRLIGLCLIVKPNGRRYWTRIDKLTQVMLKLSEEFIGSSIKQLLPSDTWSKIHNGLKLDEVGIDANGSRIP
jgi:hypothetical protein